MVIWHKIWRDLWENKARTIQAIIVIAIGTLAIGAIWGGREFITEDLAQSWQASSPATIGLRVNPAIDQTTLDNLEKIEGVNGVQGQIEASIKWRLNPDDPWQNTQLVGSADFEGQKLRKLILLDGSWPKRNQVAAQAERGLSVGDTVYLEINDKAYEIVVEGVIDDTSAPPSLFDSNPDFYITDTHFEELLGEAAFDTVYATITDYSDARAEARADLMEAELEKQDIEVSAAFPTPGGFSSRTRPPDEHIIQDTIGSLLLILTLMAVLALILGLLLVYNIISAIISNQVNQIGVMKAIGASLTQILQIYFALVVVYALLALLIAIPLGIWGAQLIRSLMLGLVEIEIGAFAISTEAVLIQLAVGLLFPPLVSMIPIMSGASITVREAISDYGLQSKAGWLERLFTADFLPRTLSLTLSNTFRNKKRLLLTQASLAGAGTIFLTVMHTLNSLVYTDIFVTNTINNVNITLDFEDPERITQVEELTLAQPGVETVEMWARAGATVRPAGQPESSDDPTANLIGLPVDTVTYDPQLAAGRWLAPEEDRAVVLNTSLAESIGVSVGDEALLNIPLKREKTWAVVGLSYDPANQQAVFMSRDALLHEIGQTARARSVRVQTRQADAAYEATVVTILRDVYEAKGMVITTNDDQDTRSRRLEQAEEQGSILSIMLGTMAAIIAAVGAIALSGTLSLNVIERTREIGVMRAIGATDSILLAQFIGEGVILGWFSWLIAIPLSFPLGQALVSVLSGLFNSEEIFQYSLSGVWYWLLIVTILAIIASWFPARQASQMSVRDSLDYS